MNKIKIIPSKSDAHRAMICAALSKEPCEIICEETSEDIEATLNCMVSWKVGSHVMECGESGSTLRFLLPVMGALGYRAEFMPRGRLSKRPLSPLYEELTAHGCKISPAGSVPLVIEGQLQPGTFTIPGNVSSQYITGLLLALPLLKGDSKIVIEGTLESKGYVSLTLDVLKKFGIEINPLEDGFFVKGNQEYKSPEKYHVEGDWSNAAFWVVAGLFTRDGIQISGLKKDSLQGDRKISIVAKAFGGKVIEDPDALRVFCGPLKAIEIDVSQIPDMVPAIALIASVAKGTTLIKNAGRLRIKESDRLKTIAETLNALGANVTEMGDGLVIRGRESLSGGTVHGAGDHRIVMMAAMASLACDGKVTITGSNAVNKSYPTFFDEMNRLELDKNIERK